MIAKKARFRIVLIRIFITAALLIFLGFSVVLNILTSAEKKLQNALYPHVSIDNRDWGGKTKNEIVSFFDQKNEKLKKISFTVIYDNNPIATLSGALLSVHFDGKGIADRAYLVGRSSNGASRLYQKMATIFNFQRFDFASTIEYENAPVAEFIQAQEDTYNRSAKNALFSFEGGKVVSFRTDEKGLFIDSEKFLKDIGGAVSQLKNAPTDKTVTLTSQVIEPEITLARANSFGIEELIAVGKSDFSHSIPERVHNIIVATSKFNGVLIPKNKIFSFGDTVGDISGLTGYQQAYVIKNGKTVLGDGGGVCQVSTTLFRAALNAGLPIVERTAHAYRVGYYENDSKPGFDATVFAPSVDFKIKNDTPAHILIQTEIDRDRNLLYFKLFGKKDGRKVEISPVTVTNLQEPPPPLYQDDPTLKRGITKQIDFAAWGSKVYFSYKVNRAGLTTFEKTFFSNYRPWQAIYLVGQAD